MADLFESIENPKEADPVEKPIEAKKESEASPPPARDPMLDRQLKELAALKSKLAEYESKEAESVAAKQKHDEEQLAKKGEFEKILKNRETELQKAKEREQRVIERAMLTERQRTIAVELGRYKIVPEMIEDVTEILSRKLMTIEDGDVYRVESSDGLPANEFIANYLKSRPNLIQAETRGSSQRSQTSQSSPTVDSSAKNQQNPFANGTSPFARPTEESHMIYGWGNRRIPTG